MRLPRAAFKSVIVKQKSAAAYPADGIRERVVKIIVVDFHRPATPPLAFCPVDTSLMDVVTMVMTNHHLASGTAISQTCDYSRKVFYIIILYEKELRTAPSCRLRPGKVPI